ncbi:MAG: histidine phosphatase family protein [Planctomycetales bacterium]|nr:histidine phosphatase family protein [Planctomycetales bacterium]
MPKILLIRAGGTAWDEEGRLRGTLDIPLSAAGIEEARARAKEAAAWRLRAVWTGTDQPARETARLVAAAVGVRVRAHEGLREPSLGLWQGLLKAEALRKHRRAFAQWGADPTAVSPPGGEPLEAAAARVAGALREVVGRARSADVVACVASPLASALVACAVLGRPAREAFAVLEATPAVAVLDPGAPPAGRAPAVPPAAAAVTPAPPAPRPPSVAPPLFPKPAVRGEVAGA